MLILHGSSDILVPPCPHHRGHIAGVAEDPRPIIVSCAIQDKILGGVGPSGVRFGIAFPCPSDSELLSHAHQMTTPRTSGRKTAIPPYLQRGLGALRMRDRPSGSFFSH